MVYKTKTEIKPFLRPSYALMEFLTLPEVQKNIVNGIYKLGWKIISYSSNHNSENYNYNIAVMLITSFNTIKISSY